MAATARREPLPLGALTVGLKCGGSDGFSGLTANPLLGRFSEQLADAGGTPILRKSRDFRRRTGLLDRALDADIFADAAALVNRFSATISIKACPSPKTHPRQSRRRYHDAGGKVARRRAKGRTGAALRRCRLWRAGASRWPRLAGSAGQ